MQKVLGKYHFQATRDKISYSKIHLISIYQPLYLSKYLLFSPEKLSIGRGMELILVSLSPEHAQ